MMNITQLSTFYSDLHKKHKNIKWSEDKITDPSKCIKTRSYTYTYIVKVFKVHILLIIHIIVGFGFPSLLQSNYGIIPSFFYTTYLGY
jgi:hypothetical protein